MHASQNLAGLQKTETIFGASCLWRAATKTKFFCCLPPIPPDYLLVHDSSDSYYRRYARIFAEDYAY